MTRQEVFDLIDSFKALDPKPEPSDLIARLHVMKPDIAPMDVAWILSNVYGTSPSDAYELAKSFKLIEEK